MSALYLVLQESYAHSTEDTQNGLSVTAGQLELAMKSYQSTAHMPCCKNPWMLFSDESLGFSDCLWVVPVDVVFLKIECTEV